VPIACSAITPQKFVDYSVAIDAAIVAVNRSNSAPGVISTIDVVFLENLKSAWSEYQRPYRQSTGSPLEHFNLTHDVIGDLSASLAPYVTQFFGYEMTARLSGIRYWAGINRFYNREASPQANRIDPTTGRTTNQLTKDAYASVERVMSKASAINAQAVNCMDALGW
jgi:hypothetical protein